MSKLTMAHLRKLILEEIKIMNEGAKEEQAASMAQNASKLLKAIEAFKASATSKAKSEFGDHLDESEKMLKRIVNSPTQYTDAPSVKSFKPGELAKPGA